VATGESVNRLESALATLARDLARHDKSAALVGGLAVSARTEPRLTRDLDLAVAVAGDAEAEGLIQALVANGYTTVALVEQEATRRLATVRLAFPGEDTRGVVADLLFASSGIEPLVVAEAEPLEVLPGLVVLVARVGHLVALKLLSRDDRRRPQDRIDLRALLKIVTDAELERARVAVELMEERGYACGRDLKGALAQWADEPPD
jgi:predicted nucleotidyltransferase